MADNAKPLLKLFGDSVDSNLVRQQMGQEASQRSRSTNSLENGVLVSGSVSTSAAAISHNLGRTPSGWLLAGVDADVRVWSTGSTSSAVTLQASGTANVSIWVF